MWHWCNLAAKERELECTCVNNDDFTLLVTGVSGYCWVYCVDITFKMTERTEQQICIKFCIKLEHSSAETMWIIQKVAAVGNMIGSFLMTMSCSCITSLTEFFWQNIKSSRWLSPLPDLVPCQLLTFPKTKIIFKGKRVQTVDEIQENMMGQLMAIGRTVWGPKVPTLKGTEASLFYVQCFWYLVSFNKCLYFSYYMAGHLLDRPHICDLIHHCAFHILVTLFL